MSEIMRNELGNPIGGNPRTPYRGKPPNPLPGFKYLIPDNSALIRGRISPGSYEETFIKSVPPKGASKVDHEVIHFPF